jgi:hypothetical protein
MPPPPLVSANVPRVNFDKRTALLSIDHQWRLSPLLHCKPFFKMDWFHNKMDVYKDPALVWRFQQLFGVERVRVENGGKPADPYVAVDYDDWCAQGLEDDEQMGGKKKRKISSSGYSSLDQVNQGTLR